jgi:phage tail-like protein
MTSAEIARLLPEVFRATLREHSVLGALIDAMAQQHGPSEQVLAGLDAFFDPMRCGEAFVPMLARWVDLERLFVPSAAGAIASGDALSTGNGRLRALVARAAELSKWRGTGRGLTEFLETATGHQGFRIDEQVAGADGVPRPFHVRVQVPPALQPHRALIERIVDAEKPAYVTCEIDFTPTED